MAYRFYCAVAIIHPCCSHLHSSCLTLWLQLHYRAFTATTGQSAPLPSFPWGIASPYTSPNRLSQMCLKYGGNITPQQAATVKLPPLVVMCASKHNFPPFAKGARVVLHPHKPLRGYLPHLKSFPNSLIPFTTSPVASITFVPSTPISPNSCSL